jgi:hypothetical protein
VINGVTSFWIGTIAREDLPGRNLDDSSSLSPFLSPGEGLSRPTGGSNCRANAALPQRISHGLFPGSDHRLRQHCTDNIVKTVPSWPHQEIGLWFAVGLKPFTVFEDRPNRSTYMTGIASGRQEIQLWVCGMEWTSCPRSDALLDLALEQKGRAGRNVASGSPRFSNKPPTGACRTRKCSFSC